MRSLLFVPADDQRKRVKSISTLADIIVLDLEDSIAEKRKATARDAAADFLSERSGQAGNFRYFVRINDLLSPHWQQDLDTVIQAKPDGILLPKARSGQDVEKLSRYIKDLEFQHNLIPGAINVMALITETPDAMLNMSSFVGCDPRMNAITWGAEDLSAELGAKSNRDEFGNYTGPFELARTLTLITARAASCEPVDTVYTNFRDCEGLKTECRKAARDGFTAKFAIHPDQIDIINDAFTPSPEEIARAQAIIEAFSTNQTDGRQTGVASIDGQMLDRPHLIQARQVLDRTKNNYD